MTTDTAVLVSHEILGQQRPFSSINFLDEPTIPMEDIVQHFLDKAMPHTNLENLPNECTDFKTQIVDAALRPQAQAFLASETEADGSTGG